MTPEDIVAEVHDVGAARSRRRRLRHRPEVVVPAQGRVPALPRGERRRRRAVHVQGPHARRARSAPAHRGHRSSRRTRSSATTRSSTCAASSRSAPSGSGRRSPTRTTRGFIGKNILGSGFDLEIILHRGAGLLHRRRRDRPALEPRGRARDAAHQAAVPRGAGRVRGADDRQQRRDACRPSRTSSRNGGEWYAAMGVNRSTGTRIFSVSGHVERPGNYEVELGMTFRELIDDLAGGVHGGKELGFFIPGGASSPWLLAEHLDAPLDMDSRAERAQDDARLGGDHGVRRDRRPAARRVAHRQVLRPRVVRQVHAVPRGLGLAREGALPDGARLRPPRRPRPAARRSATTSRPGSTWPLGHDDDLPARPEHDVAAS